MIKEFFKNKNYDNATPLHQMARADYLPLFKKVHAEVEQELKNIENQSNPSFSEGILALEHASQKLERVFSVISLIKSADADPEIEKADQEASAVMSNFANRIIQSEKIFKIVKHFNDDKDLKGEEHRLVERLYKSFVRNGALLNEDQKKRMTEIDERISNLGISFSSNVTKSSALIFLWVDDPNELEGIGDGIVKKAQETAKEKGGQSAYAFAMQGSLYILLMKTAKNRKLREKLFRAWLSIARSGEFDNSEIVREIVKLRAEKAKLLGFTSFAEYILSGRMAKKVETAASFLKDLAAASLPEAKKQIEELRTTLKNTEGISDIQPWDLLYTEELLSEEKFGFSDESLRPYFENSRVLAAAFEVAGRLYKLDFKLRNDIPIYHPEVKVYEAIRDERQIGLLYVDPFARDSKKQGAWMGNYRNGGMSFAGEHENPHVTIVTGFQKGLDGEPSLLSLDEAETVFHELGHALHSLLGANKYKSNGMDSAMWDFIELPSQFLEDWLYEREIFFKVAKHFQNGSAPSEEVYKKILERQTFMGATNMLTQLRYGILDLTMYQDPAVNLSDLEAFERSAVDAYQLLPRLPGVTMLPTFQHIVSGGYAAGYYSYMWANRLVADARKYFKDNGGFNEEIAKKFLKEVISQGDIQDADILYRNFRGRDPDNTALLEKYGLS